MSIIQCAKDCEHQRDGYCMLDKIGVITNTKGGCPHYLSKDMNDSFLEISSRKKLDIKI